MRQGTGLVLLFIFIPPYPTFSAGRPRAKIKIRQAVVKTDTNGILHNIC